MTTVIPFAGSGVFRIIQDGSAIFLDDFTESVKSDFPAVIERCVLEQSEIKVVVDMNQPVSSIEFLEDNLVILLARFVSQMNHEYNELVMKVSWEMQWIN